MLTLSLLMFISLLKAQPIVDYRMYQSDVKSQEQRGTCTAFGLVAALETLPGFPTDLSEQYLYAMAKSYSYNDETNYEEGEYLSNYIALMQFAGTVREDQEPYNPNKIIIDPKLTNFENMKSDIGGTSLLKLLSFTGFSYRIQPNMYSYRADKQARDVEYIKKMLDDGVKSIVVSYSLNGTYWSNNSGDETDKIDPNDFLFFYMDDEALNFDVALDIYGDKVFEQDADLEFTDPKYKFNGGHVVSIVGYDADGFLIKNSWGKNWGDEGYFWISFNYHRLFCNELMIPRLGKVFIDESIQDAGNWTADQFYIKSLPNTYDSDVLNMHSKSISLSIVYHGVAQMPRFTQIEYLAYDSNNNLLGTYYANTQGIFDGRETGYETYILSQENGSFPTAAKIVANFKTDKGKTFTNTYYYITATNKEYAPSK